MVMKGYSALPIASALLEPHHQIVQCRSQDTCCWESYLSAGMQSVYSAVPLIVEYYGFIEYTLNKPDEII